MWTKRLDPNLDHLRHDPLSLGPAVINGRISEETATAVTYAIKSSLNPSIWPLNSSFDTWILKGNFLQASITKDHFLHGKVVLATKVIDLEEQTTEEKSAIILFKGSYVDGVLHGTVRYSCQYGLNCVFKGDFKNGLMHGEFQTCDYLGNPAGYYELSNGKFHGSREKFHSSRDARGCIKTKSFYQHDERVGPQEYFRPEAKEKSRLWRNMGDTSIKLGLKII